MRETRRLLTVLILGLLISGLGATALQKADGADSGGDDPSFPVAEATTTTTTTITAVVPVVTDAVSVGSPGGPVRVPADPYAKEPLRELGTIEIPKIGLNHRIFEGITLRTIDNGPSHWPGTAMPGQRGNAVFAGHRVTNSKPFRNIDQLVAGDEVIFTIGGNRSVYTVVGSEIVTPKALRIVDQTPTPTATLFACHPPGSAKFRYVVHLALGTAAPEAAPAPVSDVPAG